MVVVLIQGKDSIYSALLDHLIIAIAIKYEFI